jgi:hypothetical protein
MKNTFTLKINSEKSKIPKYLDVPQKLLDEHLEKRQLHNLLPNYIRNEFKFEFDTDSKVLKSLDKNHKMYTGLYNELKLAEADKDTYSISIEMPRTRILKHEMITKHEIVLEAHNNKFIFKNNIKFYLIPQGQQKDCFCGDNYILMNS